MPIIDTDALLPGMVLSKNINDSSGRLLLHAHTVLTDKHVRILRTWGVYQVDITSISGAETPDPTNHEEITLSAQAKLDSIFSAANLDHSAMQAIYQLALNRITQRRGGVKTS